MSSQREGIRKEACWTISNITAGNADQIQAVINANLIPPLIQILITGEFKTKKEATWAISNATSGALQKPNLRPEIIRYMVQQGCIRPLCDMLSCSDNKIIQIALDGLENILKVGDMDRASAFGSENHMATFLEEAGGLEKITALQMHENMDIYKKCYNIVDKYFSEEEDGDTGIAAEVDQTGTFSFGGQMEIPQGGFNFGQ